MVRNQTTNSSTFIIREPTTKADRPSKFQGKVHFDLYVRILAIDNQIFYFYVFVKTRNNFFSRAFTYDANLVVRTIFLSFLFMMASNLTALQSYDYILSGVWHISWSVLPQSILNEFHTISFLSCSNGVTAAAAAKSMPSSTK